MPKGELQAPSALNNFLVPLFNYTMNREGEIQAESEFLLAIKIRWKILLL